MNNQTLVPLSKQIMLIMGEHAASSRMLELSAYLALQGKTLYVLDAGNRFNVYPVARMIRQQRQNPYTVLQRIKISRAFTCYQVDTIIREWQVSASVLLVFDLLSTFYDENVDLKESIRLLKVFLARLKIISQTCPVVVSTRLPAAINAERMVLYELLKEQVGEIHFEIEEPNTPPTLQLPLFLESQSFSLEVGYGQNSPLGHTGL